MNAGAAYETTIKWLCNENKMVMNGDVMKGETAMKR